MTDWVWLELDVDAFDDREFEPYLRRSGVEFVSLAELGDTAEHRRSLYELNRACAADIPGRGPFYSYADYVAQRIEVPSFTPDGVFFALRGGDWIGMSATSLRAGYAFSEMTGVLAAHRGQGLSLALKLLAVRFARDAGHRRLIACHHAANTPAIMMNRRLGFVDRDRPPDQW
ncbi:GNAT family N-acetyltransferase [Amycolatopsis sp. CA-128772]|uniref:GNAT family N-acetyltransferase n=1 Tax=Amycolatopsis sp. CA-128772 TaxID=2073159 RepID=UPI000CCFE209|nr:GNAT family N-acetyltransferase [Amycolatopsis sp. CA-128772]